MLKFGKFRFQANIIDFLSFEQETWLELEKLFYSVEDVFISSNYTKNNQYLYCELYLNSYLSLIAQRFKRTYTNY